MAVRYYAWDGEEFSADWYAVIRQAVAEGALSIGDVNDGHRSMALQAQRVREHGVWSPSNPTGAAAPSPSAPHIAQGRQDHALDIETSAIGRFQSWLRARGVETSTPIAREPWHLVADSAAALHVLADRCRQAQRRPRFTPRERVLMRRRLTAATRRVLRRQAARVQAAARRRGPTGGWGRFDREKRFQAMRRRALS